MNQFSRRHYRLVSPPADTQDQIRDRLIARQAAELGMADRIARYPTLTAENADDAIRYQEDRIKHYATILRRTP